MRSAIRTTPKPPSSTASSPPRTVKMASSRLRFVSFAPTTSVSITYAKLARNYSCCIHHPGTVPPGPLEVDGLRKVCPALRARAVGGGGSKERGDLVSRSPLMRRTSGGKHFAGGPLAGAYRFVHVTVPDLRCLRAGPVDTAHGLPQRLAVARPRTGPEAPPIAAPAPHLGRPVPLDALLGLCGPRSEEPREHREDLRLALLGRKLPRLAGMIPLQEA